MPEESARSSRRPAAAGGFPSDYPPVLYLPIVRGVADPADAQLEYRRTKDGRSALLAYSALDRLHAGMGAEQPWIVMPTAQLQPIWEVDRFDTVLLDIDVPVEFRNGAEGDRARAEAAERGGVVS
ncbi:SAV_915 family protein [Microbacterium sp. KR10-403]|uniref:SAV_915 family protein n=1 Tax=Microbacterium sp. KR10-403 TaxID=3158581 RepID=UPI0032E4DF61